MWTAKGKSLKFNEKFIYHQIPTYQGQSGAPVFSKKGKNFCMVGIHIMGSQKVKENLCIRLNEKLMNQINSWIGEER